MEGFRKFVEYRKALNHVVPVQEPDCGSFVIIIITTTTYIATGHFQQINILRRAFPTSLSLYKYGFLISSQPGHVLHSVCLTVVCVLFEPNKHSEQLIRLQAVNAMKHVELSFQGKFTSVGWPSLHCSPSSLTHLHC